MSTNKRKSKRNSDYDEEKEEIDEDDYDTNKKSKKKNKKKKNNSDVSEYESTYFDMRSNRMFIFATVLFLTNAPNLICQTYANFTDMREIEQYFMYYPYGFAKILGAAMITLACLLVFYLQSKTKNSLNNDNIGCSCCSFRGFAATLLVFGGVVEFAQAILGIIASISATQYALGKDFGCKNYVDQPVWKFERDENKNPILDTEDRNVGIQICSIPIAYEMILSILPIVMGLDLIMSKTFSSQNKKFMRLALYSLAIIASCFAFWVFLGSVMNYCNVYDKAFEETIEVRTSNTDPDNKCKRDGWFPRSFKQWDVDNSYYWNGSPNSSRPQWLPREIAKAEALFSGFMIMGVGAILAFFTAFIGVAKLSCGKMVPTTLCNCSCNGRSSLPLIKVLISLIILVGTLLVFFTGQSIGISNGYLGYMISVPQGTSNTGGLRTGTRPNADVFPRNLTIGPSLFCVAVPYFYWFIYLAVGVFVSVDIFNMSDD